jgi:hypothetical protein
VKERLRRLAQLAFAALIASAAGGVILSLLLLAASIVAAASTTGGDGPETSLADVALLLGVVIFGSGLAMVLAVGAAWLPAFIAGAALWEAGRSRAWARRRLAWALAGAAVALLCYLPAFAPGGPDPSAGRFPMPAIAASFMIAGAAAAQVYRAALTATAPFFGFDEDQNVDWAA